MKGILAYTHYSVGVSTDFLSWLILRDSKTLVGSMQ